mmetsp:Transcript_335/g.631  ORF Transcript_335/g.631 Transcript_335/m.631 type:complete len:256 (-) Transcript_335:218-985(-)
MRPTASAVSCMPSQSYAAVILTGIQKERRTRVLRMPSTERMNPIARRTGGEYSALGGGRTGRRVPRGAPLIAERFIWQLTPCHASLPSASVRRSWSSCETCASSRRLRGRPVSFDVAAVESASKVSMMVRKRLVEAESCCAPKPLTGYKGNWMAALNGTAGSWGRGSGVNGMVATSDGPRARTPSSTSPAESSPSPSPLPPSPAPPPAPPSPPPLPPSVSPLTISWRVATTNRRLINGVGGGMAGRGCPSLDVKR